MAYTNTEYISTIGSWAFCLWSGSFCQSSWFPIMHCNFYKLGPRKPKKIKGLRFSILCYSISPHPSLYVVPISDNRWQDWLWSSRSFLHLQRHLYDTIGTVKVRSMWNDIVHNRSTFETSLVSQFFTRLVLYSFLIFFSKLGSLFPIFVSYSVQ